MYFFFVQYLPEDGRKKAETCRWFTTCLYTWILFVSGNWPEPLYGHPLYSVHTKFCDNPSTILEDYYLTQEHTHKHVLSYNTIKAILVTITAVTSTHETDAQQ